MRKTLLASVHGGHSGQFCSHAYDTLEEIVQRYIEKKFSWVGITEHTPVINESSLYYPDDIAAGLTPELILDRLDSYMVECRRLQNKYRDQIVIFPGLEIETYADYEQFVPYLINRFQPDYIVGSVHFVDDIGFDYSPSLYNKAVETAGSIDELYCRYYDKQYEMIKILQPAVVGHFDLIRIFDTDYKSRHLKPTILKRIKRNLKLIKDLDLIMDFNLRSMHKGAEEPYITRTILEMVRKLGIAVVPGDDSHSLDTVGNYMSEGIKILEELGFNTNWRRPRLLR